MAVTKIPLPFRVTSPILAFGAHTKNRICFAHGRSAFLSELHSDLSELNDYLRFEKDARLLLSMKPRVIAYDPHPDYASSRFCLSLKTRGVRLIPVQHHHAHIASCMADNGISTRKVIGVAFDGTGLGSDGILWGAEWLVGNERMVMRRAHLKEVMLIGGAAAIRQPWRVLAAWFCANKKNAPRIISARECALIRTLCGSAFSWPLASSMGRLFDAVGAMVLHQKKASHEGELAMALERVSSGMRGSPRAYPYGIAQRDGAYVIDPFPLLAAVSRDCANGQGKAETGLRFHVTVAAMVRDVCLRLKKEYRIRRVVLSGGVFHNRLLLSMVQESLTGEGFTVFSHRTFSCGDEGLAVGQVAVAHHSAY